MPNIDEDTSHPPVPTRKRKTRPRKRAKETKMSEGAIPLPENISRTQDMNAANGVKVEQLLGDDGEDSNMAILRNDSIADPSCKNSDGDLAAKKPSGFYSHAEDSSTGTDSRRRSQNGSVGREKFVTAKTSFTPDPPEKYNSTVKINVLPPISNGVVYLCTISCKPAAMPAKEKRMLIKEFLQHLNIKPCLGQVVFLNGHTFLTNDLHHRLNRRLFLGSFCHRRSKFHEKFKLVNTCSEMQPRVWSSLYHCTLTEKSPAASKLPGRPAHDNLKPFEASASCTVETINFSDLCGPKRHQEPQDFMKYISDFNNMYSPGLPSVAPDAPGQEQIVVHGNRTFDFGQPGYSLGFGLEARTGTLLVIRATEKGLVRVVTPCQRIFFAPMKASTFMIAHWPDYALDPIKASAELDSVFRGLRVVVRQANGVERSATVSEVSLTCPQDTAFEFFEKGVKVWTTVEEYFSTRHKIPLTDLTLPCLNVGSTKRPQYFPSCVCHILPGQSFRKKVPIQAAANLHRLKQRLPSTFEQPSSSKSNDRALFANSVDLIESTSIFQVTPRREGEDLLDLSSITYKALSNPNRPQPFKLSDSKLSVPLIFAEIGNAPAMSAQVGLLVSILNRKLESSGNSHGIQCSEPCKLKLSEGTEVWTKTLEARTGRRLGYLSDKTSGLEGQSNLQQPMVIAMIDGANRNKEAYQTVKSYFDVDRGFQCTCVNLSTLEKAHTKDPDSGIDKYASSLLRKVLAKANTQPIGQEESSERNGHQGAKPQPKTLLVGFHVAHLPPKSNLENGQHSLLISVATKSLGLMGPYKITTVIENIATIDELNLCKILETHIQGVEGDFIPNSHSRILIFRSGFCQLPVIDKISPPPPTSRDEIIKTEVDRFQELSLSEALKGVNIIYVTVEKPLKLKIFMKGDSHPNENGKLRNGLDYSLENEYSPKSLVMQEGVSHPEDCELFFMKETRGEASHYPLRVRVRSGGGGDTGPGSKWEVEPKTIDEIFQATHDYPPGVDSAILPAPIYFARRACKRALLLTLENARTLPHTSYSVIDVNDRLKNTLYYL